MINIYSREIISNFYLIFPIILALIILLKKDRFEPDGTFWKKQQWKCFDVLLIVTFFSFLQLVSLFLSKYHLISYYYLFIYGTFISLFLLGGVLFWILYYKNKSNFAALSITNNGVCLNIIIGLSVFFLYAIFIIVLLFLIDAEYLLYNRAQLFFKLKLYQLPKLDSTIYIIGIIVLAPFVEECVFRGFMYGPFYKKIGSFGSICLSAIIWSTVHIQIKASLTLFLIGILLGYLYKKTQSLIPGVIVHAMMNLSNLLIYVYMINKNIALPI